MLISQTIDDALLEISVKNAGEEASPADHAFGLRTLNRIIDSYNTQNLLITYLEDMTIQAPYLLSACEVTPEELVAGGRQWKNSITIGHCQDIDMEAPMEIQDLFWRQSNETDYYSKMMAFNQWSDITTKSNTGIPRRHYIQKMDNNNVKIYFDYIPQADLELHLLAKMPYTGKNSTGNDYCPTDDILWNFGFEKMLMKRLAIELCPSYEVQPSQVLVAAAQEAEMHVKRNNSQPMTLDSDVSLTSRVGRRSGYNNRGRR